MLNTAGQNCHRAQSRSLKNKTLQKNVILSRPGPLGPRGPSPPQEIPDISGYEWGFGCQFGKAYITENPVRNQKIL